MAEENNNSVDQTIENFHDASEATESVKVSDLTRKIQTLEHEKHDLVEENKQYQERVDELIGEIEEWRREEAVVKEKIEQMGKQLEDSEESKRALDSVASRCADLEGEVVRLQDEYVGAVTEANEANNEVEGLKKEVLGKEKRVEGLEVEIDALKKSRADLERQVREYERKLGLLEMKESEEKSKKLRVEEELREKEGKIVELKKKVKELEGVVLKNGKDAENWAMEKRGLEMKVGELLKEVEDADKVIGELKENTFDGINGGLDREIGGEDGLKLTVWAIGSAGAVVAAAALMYVRYGRKN